MSTTEPISHEEAEEALKRCRKAARGPGTEWATVLAYIRQQASREADVAAAIPPASAEHVHEVSRGKGKPGSGVYTEWCRRGAQRTADWRGLSGENVEPKCTEWKGGKP